MASESTSQTEVCLQVLGTDIVISECQDLYTIYGFMRPSSDPEIIFKRTLNTPNTITESTFIYSLPLGVGRLFTGVLLGVGQGLPNHAILSPSLATRGR